MPARLPPPSPPTELPRLMFWRLRRNPLRRRSDLTQAWIGVGLLLAAPAATTPVMFHVGDTAHGHYSRIAQQQAATRHHTTATLMENARRHPEPGSAEARETRYPTKVRFPDPHGRAHTATTDVAPAMPKGSTIRVWADTEGRITEPPLSPDQVRNRATGSALVAALAVHAVAAAAYGTAHHIIQRRNLAAWNTEWARTAPRWRTSP
ncbi:hypothetical protein [Streptomyces sp. NPDC050534]|uniref:Rv1733c family protein n=1 Tax=Streptomyces sp. NPDC050534 TaxID=3365625 RepID=UPI003798D501